MKLMSILSFILSRLTLAQILWERWDIRAFLLASFTFQLILILSAPFRKRTSNVISRATLWLSYLLTNLVAAQAIGLIARVIEFDGYPPDIYHSLSEYQYPLFTFWAQLLLIHLGGPDTITALALEDNELWLRTCLQLGTQAFATLGVISNAAELNSMSTPSILMFLAGVVKYLERVICLFHGRLLDSNDDPKQYAQQLTENQKKKGDQQLTTSADVEDESKRLTEVEIVRDAYNLFHCYKRLFADRVVSRKVRIITQEYLARRTPKEAYKLLEIQLNFAYEAIYTKMAVIHRKAWKILRHLVLLLEVLGLVIWFFTEKGYYPEYDIRITYTLVVGAVAVDVLSLLRIHYSDWNIAHLDPKKFWNSGFYNMMLAARSEEHDGSTILWSWFRKIFLKRWSESIHQAVYTGGFSETLFAVFKIFHLEMFAIRQWAVSKKRVSSEMWEFIFEEVVRMSLSESKKYKLANGEEVDIDSLLQTALPTNTLDHHYFQVFKHWSEDFMEDSQQHISMTLQRYLLYLITFHPNMMFGAAGKEKLFKSLDPLYRLRKKDVQDSDEEEDGNFLIQRPYDVCAEINCTDEEKEGLRSELLDRAWVRLLCYAAIRCSPRVHAESLKEGGELLSFVWLLMVQLNITKL